MNNKIKFLEILLADLVAKRDTLELDLNIILNQEVFWAISEYIIRDFKKLYQMKYYEKNETKPKNAPVEYYDVIDETEKGTDQSSNGKSFISNWLGVKYQYGGMSRSGIDCSALTQKFFRTVFNQTIKRTSILQFRDGKVVRKSELEYGDLVFFKNVRSNASVAHVGIYLGHSKFLHASKSNGVMISSLNE